MNIESQVLESQPVETTKDTPVSKHFSEGYQQFLQEIESKTDVDGKLRTAIDFMSQALAKSGFPNFKEFWEVRKLCLALFKEDLQSTSRTNFWKEYRELTLQARKLKEILDEQTDFAIEQVDLALTNLENDIDQYDALLAKMSHSDLPVRQLKKNADLYQTLHKELTLSNTLATRIHGLRKEVIKMQMRVGMKGKLFKRLSKVGDKIFPKRKELIKQVSDLFAQDVKNFVELHFSETSDKSVPFFTLRDDIKNLQSVAKTLTLNTKVFTSTRMSLSECWDKIKKEEKDKKQEYLNEKNLQAENAQKVREKINEVRLLCIQGLTKEDAAQKVKEVVDFMSTLSLQKQDIAKLHSELTTAQDPVLEKEKMERELKEKQRLERIEKKQKRLDELKEDLFKLLQEAHSHSEDSLTQRLDELKKEISELELSKIEKQIFDRHLRPLSDVLIELRQNSLINLTDDEKLKREKLQLLLSQRLEEKKVTKELVEKLRKSLGGSSLDIEKGMALRENFEYEKERLEKIVKQVEELQAAIEEIEGR